MIEQIPDHAKRGVDRLLSQLAGKPRLAAIVSSWLEVAQEVEDVVFALRLGLVLSSSTGFMLDALGAKVGQAREGREDDHYRLWIAARIWANRSHGTAAHIYAMLASVSPDGAAMRIDESGDPATFRLWSEDPLQHEAGALIAELLQVAKPLGVRASHSWHQAATASVFRLSASGTAELDADHGLGRGRLIAHADEYAPWFGPPQLDGAIRHWWSTQTSTATGSDITDVADLVSHASPLSNGTPGTRPAVGRSVAVRTMAEFGSGDTLDGPAFAPAGAWLAVLFGIWTPGVAGDVLDVGGVTLSLSAAGNLSAPSIAGADSAVAVAGGELVAIGVGFDPEAGEVVFRTQAGAERLAAVSQPTTPNGTVQVLAGIEVLLGDVALYSLPEGRGLASEDVERACAWFEAEYSRTVPTLPEAGLLTAHLDTKPSDFVLQGTEILEWRPPADQASLPTFVAPVPAQRPLRRQTRISGLDVPRFNAGDYLEAPAGPGFAVGQSSWLWWAVIDRPQPLPSDTFFLFSATRSTVGDGVRVAVNSLHRLQIYWGDDSEFHASSSIAIPSGRVFVAAGIWRIISGFYLYYRVGASFNLLFRSGFVPDGEGLSTEPVRLHGDADVASHGDDEWSIAEMGFHKSPGSLTTAGRDLYRYAVEKWQV